MRTTLRATGAAALTAALTTGLVVAGASTASAHVTISPDTTVAGSYALLTVGVPHGCDGSPTTRVSILVPEQVASVTPTLNPAWDVEKVMVELDEPIDDGHGGQRAERVGEVVYTAKSALPEGYRDAFVLSLKLPDLPGEELVFPAIQECEEGESAWAQVPQDGQDPDELELPAPRFVLTSADGDDAAPASDDAGTSTGGDALAAAPAPASTDAAPSVATWAALALGAGGLVLGGLAFLRTRRTQG